MRIYSHSWPSRCLAGHHDSLPFWIYMSNKSRTLKCSDIMPLKSPFLWHIKIYPNVGTGTGRQLCYSCNHCIRWVSLKSKGSTEESLFMSSIWQYLHPILSLISMRIPLKKACLGVDCFFRGSLIPQKSILGERDGEKLSKLSHTKEKCEYQGRTSHYFDKERPLKTNLLDRFLHLQVFVSGRR